MEKERIGVTHSEGKMSPSVCVHKFPSDRLAASIIAGFALSRWSSGIGMSGMPEHTGRPGWRVGWHELPMLWQSDQCLVSVVVATECRDDTLVEVVQETLLVAALV